MRIAMIVAVAKNGVIGREGDLPWRLSSDLKRFRKLTMDKPVIMGRKTFHSLPKPLDGRDSIILTRQNGPLSEQAEHIHYVTSIEAALSLAEKCAAERGAEEIMIIGGAEIYRSMLAKTQRIYMSKVDAESEGDAYFPEIEENEWDIIERRAVSAGPKDDYNYSLITYQRKA